MKTLDPELTLIGFRTRGPRIHHYSGNDDGSDFDCDENDANDCDSNDNCEC